MQAEAAPLLQAPAGQSRHCVDRGLEVYLPGMQSPQAEASIAPLSIDAVPGSQGMQPADVCPVEGLKEPLGQGVQFADDTAPPEFRNVPSGQVAHVSCARPSEKDPGKQAAHRSAPLVLLAVPGPQGAQAASCEEAPRVVPQYPGGQRREQEAWPGLAL